MRLVTGGAILLLSALVGCAAPEIRFTRTECLPVVGDAHTEAVRFISDFEANGAVPEQQLVFQVAVVDGAGRPVQSRTGRYKDVSGNLMAAKGVMLLQSPWVFENINVAIPAPELNAARQDGAAYADFQLASPDGQVLVRERVRLPAEFAAAAPSRETPIARATESQTRRAEPESSEVPEIASAAGDSGQQEAPREEPRAAPPLTRPPAGRSGAAQPPSGARPSSSGRKPETIVRETRPVSPPQGAESSAPPSASKRDERSSASASRRPVRETEVESTPPRESAPPAREATEPAANTASADRAGQTEIVYTVKAADSLRSISLEHYGDAQYWPLILRANPEVNPLKLKAGDRLVLPALDSTGSAGTTAPRAVEKTAGSRSEAPVYVTKEGDTLPFIAKQLYGDSRRWREIYDLNRDQLETPSSVRAGQRLKLPAPARTDENSRPTPRP